MKAAYVIYDMNNEEYVGICPNYEDLSSLLLHEASVTYIEHNDETTEKEIDDWLQQISNYLYDNVKDKNDDGPWIIEDDEYGINYCINLVPLFAVKREFKDL